MDVFPAEIEDGGYDRADESDEEDDDGGDLCRICRSPEGPEDPLRYPCACRGSIKYVHQECLRLWLNRRGIKQCEVCRRSYSFVPVYSENAPERLPWHEFLRVLTVRALRVAAYVFALLFNAFSFSLHPWGRSSAAENQSVLGVSETVGFLLAGFYYCGWIAYAMTIIALLRPLLEHIFGFARGIDGENEQGRGGGVVGAARMLWKCMGVLCDWWHGHIVRIGLFRVVMDNPRNPQLREFGPIWRFLFLLQDNAFAVLAISFCASFFFILLPLMIGSLVSAFLLLSSRMGIATKLLSGNSLSEEPVYVGYLAILSVSLAYLGSFATLSRDTVQAIAKGLSMGFVWVATTIPYVLWICSAKLWRNLYVVKDGFVLCLKFGVLPLLLACWFDFCTLPIRGTTVPQRLKFLSDYPFSVILHWMYGTLWLLWVSNSMELVQKMLQKRPFWFLLDVTDPNYKLTKLYIGQFLFALAFHASLIVILVHLPIMTISFISPSFFPLHLWIYEERIMFLSISAYAWLGRIRVVDWLVGIIKPAIEPIVRKWIITVSSWLQLSDFFLENHANQNVRHLLQQELEAGDGWSLLGAIVEGPLVRFYESQNDTTSEEYTDDNRFIILRIGLMMVLAALSLFLISTISMCLPILVGRTFFHSISFIMINFGIKKQDDVYGFLIGCYILRVSYVGACFILNHIMSRRTDVLLNLVLLWIRNAILFSIWVSFIPMLLGLLIDLMIIIPSLVQLSEPPVYSLFRDWLIGLVVLHIWTYLTMFTRVNCFATAAWREKLDRIKSDGINRLTWTWLLGNVMCPIIINLLTTLAFPFWVANSLFPLLQFSGEVNLAVQRLIWPVLLAIIIIAFVAKLTLDLFRYIHRVEYDDRYMVGERVSDFIEDQV